MSVNQLYIDFFFIKKNNKHHLRNSIVDILIKSVDLQCKGILLLSGYFELLYLKKYQQRKIFSKYEFSSFINNNRSDIIMKELFEIAYNELLHQVKNEKVKNNFDFLYETPEVELTQYKINLKHNLETIYNKKEDKMYDDLYKIEEQMCNDLNKFYTDGKNKINEIIEVYNKKPENIIKKKNQELEEMQNKMKEMEKQIFIFQQKMEE